MKSMDNSPTISIKDEASITFDTKSLDLSPIKPGHVTFGTSKKVIRSKLKAVLWVCAYPYLLKKKLNSKILVKKRKQDIVTSHQVIQFGVSILEFIQKHCFVVLMRLYKETRSLILINDEEEEGTEISRQDTEKRVIIILVKEYVIDWKIKIYRED